MRRVLFVVTAIAAGIVQADVLQVPAQFDTIQEAIDASGHGDEVLVADGRYRGPGNRGLDYLGKAITVRSENGPEDCIIDCDLQDRGFFFHSGEDSNSVVSGFTITNGSAPNGGAIECTLESGPTIEDCIFAFNEATALGGGVSCRGFSDAIIRRCTFISNRALGGQGDTGGGLGILISSPQVSDCAFFFNEARHSGAIDCGGCETEFINCLIVGNTALLGGGLQTVGGNPTFTNCTIAFNTAEFGGGVQVGGVALGSNPVFNNSIIWGNMSDQIRISLGEPTVNYSLVEGGWPGTGNIDANPRFVRPSADDYRLRPDSPCIDAGNNRAVPGYVDMDLDGLARFVDDPAVPDTGRGTAPIVDMGAYEKQSDCRADFNNDGSLNTLDFIAYLNAYNEGDPSADFNADGIVNTLDFLAFLNEYNAGCE